ncbi:hypothetical protein SKAU_G00207660 [Synaphobranchus kaupii]|uniref:DDE Tnp4 domain-containing protein n=1 Tax=Synaphobranchus kaupii TaxID=118154 RepID=A0A9Q1F849_SYNKA|nr:hypothetical protein SKAU_G00207660 [Synaphobranchus kaupii]
MIEEQPVDFFLLGDPAYPLMDWLMKGYIQSPAITPEQESFNIYLSSARAAVEMAFGRLKHWIISEIVHNRSMHAVVLRRWVVFLIGRDKHRRWLGLDAPETFHKE